MVVQQRQMASVGVEARKHTQRIDDALELLVMTRSGSANVREGRFLVSTKWVHEVVSNVQYLSTIAVIPEATRCVPGKDRRSVCEARSQSIKLRAQRAECLRFNSRSSRGSSSRSMARSTDAARC